MVVKRRAGWKGCCAHLPSGLFCRGSSSTPIARAIGLWYCLMPIRVGLGRKRRGARVMSRTKGLFSSVAAIAIAAFLAGAPARLDAQAAAHVSIGATDLGGVVSGPNGPEAGVWVIAETTDLPTRMAKIVVTDDQGRYVLPELPKAKYSVWVRGYGLVDSPKIETEPGKIVNLTAVPAPNEAAAAEFYPPIYWLSMAKMPEKSEFPGTGHSGNGINEKLSTQPQFLREFKTDGCFHCHSVGNKATRTIPEALGKFSNGYEAWTRRIQHGQASGARPQDAVGDQQRDAGTVGLLGRGEALGRADHSAQPDA